VLYQFKINVQTILDRTSRTTTKAYAAHQIPAANNKLSTKVVVHIGRKNW